MEREQPCSRLILVSFSQTIKNISLLAFSLGTLDLSFSLRLRECKCLLFAFTLSPHVPSGFARFVGSYSWLFVLVFFLKKPSSRSRCEMKAFYKRCYFVQVSSPKEFCSRQLIQAPDAYLTEYKMSFVFCLELQDFAEVQEMSVLWHCHGGACWYPDTVSFSELTYAGKKRKVPWWSCLALQMSCSN